MDVTIDTAYSIKQAQNTMLSGFFLKIYNAAPIEIGHIIILRLETTKYQDPSPENISIGMILENMYVKGNL